MQLQRRPLSRKDGINRQACDAAAGGGRRPAQDAAGQTAERLLMQ